MNKAHASPVIFKGTLVFLAIISSICVYAGDEDMNPSLYQRFDPETGYMVPIDEAAVAPGNHAPAQQQKTQQQLPEEPVRQTVNRIHPSFIFAAGGIILVGFILIILQNRRKHIQLQEYPDHKE